MRRIGVVRRFNYLEIQNFRRFGDRQRIALDHPAVLIGPNNCGKTTAIQAIALWSQAVRTWFEAARELNVRCCYGRASSTVWFRSSSRHPFRRRLGRSWVC